MSAAGAKLCPLPSRNCSPGSTPTCRWPGAHHPRAWYFDPAIADRERRRGLRRHLAWPPGGPTRCRDRGSFVTVDIAGEPIVVVRDEQATLRAFHNVCRHRAAQVINEPAGQGSASCAAAITAGRTTSRAGCAARRSSTASRSFAARTTACRRWPSTTWGPFVWVHLGTPPQPLAECLGAAARARGVGASIDAAAVRRRAGVRARLQLEGVRR